MLFDSGGKAFWLAAVLLVSELEVKLCRDVIQDVPHMLLPTPQPQLSAGMVAGVLNSWHTRTEIGLLAFKVPETTSKTEKSATPVENWNEDSNMLPEDRDLLHKLWTHFQI